ncbi:hypothetical protein HJFPF1_13249 [Paramyrothecium foliicola]|nr:hypothetical protein HJFPF1_13249 [Paramyrothecium foliicola]
MRIVRLKSQYDSLDPLALASPGYDVLDSATRYALDHLRVGTRHHGHATAAATSLKEGKKEGIFAMEVFRFGLASHCLQPVQHSYTVSPADTPGNALSLVKLQGPQGP